MKITVLIENQAPEGLTAEHGLALHIEYKGKQYLLDAGASDAFLCNADKMGIHLSDVGTAFLSHAHFDHSGGYEGFFRKNPKARVYLRRGSKEDCYKKVEEDFSYVGIPAGTLERYKERFVYVEGKAELDRGVWLVPHHKGSGIERALSNGMYRKRNGYMELDDLKHEQSVVFELEEGLVILSSCSHSGIDSIIDEIKKEFPGYRIYAVVGGFHLMGPGGAATMYGAEEEVRLLAEYIEEAGIQKVYTGHCTGIPAYRVMKHVLGDKLEYLRTGLEITL